tara:strand:- start:6265 stop:8367 length:2103 start_codon:yes stop_codon:yes gene_type:complete
MANGYEEFNPAEQAAREAQEKALAKTLEDQGGVPSPDVSGMSGIVQPVESDDYYLKTGETPNIMQQNPLYQQPGGQPVTNGNGQTAAPAEVALPGSVMNVVPGQDFYSPRIIPGGVQTAETPEEMAGLVELQRSLGLGGYEPQPKVERTYDPGAPTIDPRTGQQVLTPLKVQYPGTEEEQEEFDIKKRLTGDPEAQTAFAAGEAQQKQQQMAGTPLVETPTAPTATTAQQGDADWADEDFNKAWGQVNNPNFDMANIGQYLKFHTPQMEIEGQLVAGSPVMTDRSRALLDRAVTVEGQKRATEQQEWDRKIQTAQATGKFGDKDTLAKKQQDFDQKMTEAQITGRMQNNANTLARDRLELEKNIQQADQTGFFDSDIGGRSKTLAREKLEHEKELADAQADLQQASIMGVHPSTGFKTFAKQQWMDQLDMDEKRYDEEVNQRIGDQSQRLLSILGTSPAGAYVRDENNIIKRGPDGEPILQTLESRKLAEDITQRNLDRATANSKITELVRSNQEAEKIRLIELGYNEDEATTLADRRLAAQIRAEEANEALRDKEIELERTMLASQMDFQRQQLASQNLALMLQNPAAFGALTALTGGRMPQQLQGLGMQVPTTQQPAQTAPQTPQQGIGQFFQGGIPTMGQLGQLDPQALQTLTNMLGFAGGITPQQFGRAAAGVTPGGIQTAAPRIFGGGMPTGRRT